MDETKFTDSKTGRLVRISTREGHDWAFLPDHPPTPFSVPIDPSPLACVTLPNKPPAIELGARAVTGNTE